MRWMNIRKDKRDSGQNLTVLKVSSDRIIKQRRREGCLKKKDLRYWILKTSEALNQRRCLKAITQSQHQRKVY